ncbi:MAG: carboxypeptidase-like regulatory domain-containing protein, partial [Planctomycetia bacterium]
HEGQPVVGATVGFSPTDDKAGLPANGVTDTTGTFRLTAARGGARSAGTAVGEYIVTISKCRARQPAGPMPADGSPQLEHWNNEALRLAALPPIHELPAICAEVPTSPLRATVKRGRNTGPSMRFELEGKL